MQPLFAPELSAIVDLCADHLLPDYCSDITEITFELRIWVDFPIKDLVRQESRERA